MRPIHTPSLALNVVIALPLAGVLAGSLGGLVVAQQPQPTETRLTLTHVSETRAIDVHKAQADDGMVITGMSDEPGLELTFSLNLPAGLHIMSLAQPTRIAATDSAGTDLTKIEPGFGAELEYLDLEHDFDEEDDQCEIALRLAVSARTAVTFDASATFNAMVFTGSNPLNIEATKDWVALPAGTIEMPQPVRVRATDDGLAFEPAEVEDWIEKVEIKTDEREVVESNGWFSDGSTLTYMFDDVPDDRPVKMIITVRNGVKTIPLSIEVTKQALP